MRYRSPGIVIPFLVIVCLGIYYPGKARAQSHYDIEMSYILMNNGQYQEACDRLQPLLSSDSLFTEAYPAAIKCLTYLKKYDQAISLTLRALGGHYKNISIADELGKLYHLKGDTAKALEVWNQTLKANNKNLMAYREIAISMRNNGEYEEAISTLLEARKRFGNHLLFLSELVDTYLQAGKNKQAILEFLGLLKSSPRQVPLIEALLQRFGDETLYAEATQTINDELRHSSGAYNTVLQELLVWLNFQNHDYNAAYKNALAMQKKYPNRAPLYEAAGQLAAVGKFDLARDAYRWYVDHPTPVITPHSMEQLALLDIRRASFNETNMLSSASATDSLYRSALARLQQLSNDYPDYTGMPGLLLELGELSLDFNHDTATAQKMLERMRIYRKPDSLRGSSDFLLGRIRLFAGDFDHARVSFTRAEKKAVTDSLSDKARFYLVLNDFYAGDFTFAKRQIESLERNPSSPYANDALGIGQWLQEGMIGDSVTGQLKTFARARFLKSTGRDSSALDILAPYVLTPEPQPMKDAMVLLYSSILQARHPSVSLLVTNWFVQNQQNGPMAERLLWQRARLANGLLGSRIDTLSIRKWIASLPRRHRNLLKNVISASGGLNGINKLCGNKEDVVPLYEQILIRFPNGFYADYCRQRIRYLQDKLQS